MKQKSNGNYECVLVELRRLEMGIDDGKGTEQKLKIKKGEGKL